MTDNGATATSQVVVFSNGFEADGTDAVAAPDAQTAMLEIGAAVRFTWPDSADASVATVFAARACVGPCPREGADFRVERVGAGNAAWTRIVARDAYGNERASAWIPVATGEEVVLVAIVSESASGRGGAPGDRALLLYASGAEAWLPIVSDTARWQLSGVVPITDQPIEG